MTPLLAVAPASSADPSCTPDWKGYCVVTSTGETIYEYTFTTEVPSDEQPLAWLVPVHIVVTDPLTGQVLLDRDGYCLSFVPSHSDCVFAVKAAGQPLTKYPTDWQDDLTITVKAYYLEIGVCVAAVDDCTNTAVPVTQVPLIEIN